MTIEDQSLTVSILKLVGFFSVNEAIQLRKLLQKVFIRQQVRIQVSDNKQVKSVLNNTLNVFWSTCAQTSCRIISCITTSASVLKSWTNFLFLSAPVFSCTSNSNNGASCLHTRATLAAFSATLRSRRNKFAIAENKHEKKSSEYEDFGFYYFLSQVNWSLICTLAIKNVRDLWTIFVKGWLVLPECSVILQ